MAKEQPIELFMPPNMLKAKVGGSIAGIDLSVLKRAETALETLKTEFHTWVRDDVAKLNAARDAFAANPNASSCEELYRISLDMTGQAGTFEFPLVARVAKSLCDLVVAADAPADIPISLVDAHVNAIRIIFRDNIKSQRNPMALELASELEARVAELAQNAAA
jgi:hypothetical protein